MPKRDIKKNNINEKQERVIWLFKDGKPGHESQVEGLASSLERLKPTEVYSVNLEKPLHRSLLSLIFKRNAQSIPWASFPKPDLIIGAGHKTHLWLLAAQLFVGGKTVLMMKPTLPAWLYNLVLIPSHDKPASSANIIETQGVLNKIISTGDRINDRGLILLGGLSQHYHWDSHSIIQQITRLIEDNPNIKWEMTTSRRTPAETEELLLKLSAKNLSFTPNEATDASWVSNRLKIASRVWVTVDSVSMVYEAITSGAEVGLLSLESSSSKSRVAAAIEDLKQQKIVLTDTHLAEDYSRRDEVFNEADRCALLILKKFFENKT